MPLCKNSTTLPPLAELRRRLPARFVFGSPSRATPIMPPKLRGRSRRGCGRNSTTSFGRSSRSAPAGGAARCIRSARNAINDRTIGESAQGVGRLCCRLVAANPAGNDGLRCAIAYDTRHQSRHFAELCGEIMAAAGFKVYFLDGFRSTPELSFAVRHFRCACGIMITASHNPPSDNAVKVYWSTGGQMLPPHDEGIIDRVMNVGEIRRIPFADGLASGRIVCCQAEVDAAYIAAVRSQALPGPRTLKILYSPLHGVGGSSRAAGAGGRRV